MRGVDGLLPERGNRFAFWEPEGAAAACGVSGGRCGRGKPPTIDRDWLLFESVYWLACLRHCATPLSWDCWQREFPRLFWHKHQLPALCIQGKQPKNQRKHSRWAARRLAYPMCRSWTHSAGRLPPADL